MSLAWLWVVAATGSEEAQRRESGVLRCRSCWLWVGVLVVAQAVIFSVRVASAAESTRAWHPPNPISSSVVQGPKSVQNEV
jgi:hypothetical protein